MATETQPVANNNGKASVDNGVLNNGVKLLGEAVVPGASLLLEKHIGAGLILGTLGVLGGAAFGSVFGPLGYVLARYGASAVSFSQSLEPEPKPKNGTSPQAIGAAVGDAIKVALPDAISRSMRMPMTPSAESAPADMSHQLAAAMRMVLPEFAAAIRAATPPIQDNITIRPAAPAAPDIATRVAALEQLMATTTTRRGPRAGAKAPA